MAKKKSSTEKFSMKGYSLKVWFNDNKLFFIDHKDEIKGIIVALGSLIALKFGSSPAIQALFGIGGAYGTKFIIDAIDYFLKE